MDLLNYYLIPTALGISLSACCGFRVFIPLLVAGLAAKFKYLPLSAGFEWMSSWPAIICFGVASLAEVVAYYFPVIDNLLDTVTTPSAFIAGTALSASVFTEFDPMTKWISAIVAGGGTAGAIQAGTGILRLGSTKLTAGLGNGIIATAENALSIIGSILALIVPVVIFSMVVVGVVAILYRVFLRKHSTTS
ncbi:MAG: DUF4126 domain-containing protein [Chitinophagales bacterium]|nr:DUF4126 domain-containing protein [Chitinophagales bacterium]